MRCIYDPSKQLSNGVKLHATSTRDYVIFQNLSGIVTMAFIFRDGSRGSRDIILTAVISNFTLFLIQKTV